MHDRSTWFIAHGVDPVEWAARYGLDAFTAECYRCNAPCTTTLPFADGNLRGLVAPVCPCGHPTPPYCLVAIGGTGALSDLFPPSRRRRRR